MKPTTHIDWAVQQISDAVLTGRFVPGQKLKAADLAREWNISPTPVREALQRFTATGLIEALPNRGLRVAQISTEEMREVYSLRLLLEPLALRMSLENRDDSWREEISRAYAALESELEAYGSDLLAFERVHTEFHLSLLSRSDSAWLMRISDMLGTHSMRYRLLSLGPRGYSTDLLLEHRALLDACLSDDIDEAVTCLFEHIRRTVVIVADPIEGDRLTRLIDAAGDLLHSGAAS